MHMERLGESHQLYIFFKVLFLNISFLLFFTELNFPFLSSFLLHNAKFCGIEDIWGRQQNEDGPPVSHRRYMLSW